MDHYDELKLRELTSRMGGHSLQQEFVSLVWTEEVHPILRVQLPVLMDNLDEMDRTRLASLVNVLSMDVCRNSPRVAATALRMVLVNASDGRLYRWVEVIEKHYERLMLDEYALNLSDTDLMAATQKMRKYDHSFTKPLTIEQEWALLSVTLMGMDGSNPAVKGELSGRGRWIRDVELVRYIANNPKRAYEIAKVMSELQVVRPVEIDAYLDGEPSALMSGML